MLCAATLVIRVDALESHSYKVQVAGYALLNPFVKLGTKEQPEKANHQVKHVSLFSF